MKLNEKKIYIIPILLAILMTIATLAITNVYWLVPKPIDICLKASDKADFSLSIELNKKNDNKFIDIKSSQIDKVISGNVSQVLLNVYDIKSPKKIRIKFSNLDSNNDITVNDIIIKGKNTKELDLTKINVECAEIINKNESSITFKPNATTVTLYYPETLDIYSGSSINYKSLILIIGVCFLFFYFLINYIFSFKYSKSDLILLIIFVLFLFIPIIHIDNRIISKQENRTLARIKPLIYDNQINFKFFEELNNWYNDRFFLRQEMCNINSLIIYYLNSHLYKNRNYFIDKKNNWIFRIGVSNYEYTNEIKDKYIKNLIKFNEFCKKNNIKFYILVIPEKEMLYKELVSIHRYRYDIRDKDYYDFNKNNVLKIIYPYEELKEASKKNYIYYKSEHHLTDYGTYIAYKALVKEIKKDFPNFVETNINDFNKIEHNFVRGTYDRTFEVAGGIKILNLPPQPILDVNYPYFNHKDYKNIKIINNIYERKRIYIYKKSKNKLKAILIGNSMTIMLSDIMSHDFIELVRTSGNNGKRRSGSELKISGLKQECNNYHPDIIILNMTPSYAIHILEMYDNF